MITRFALVSVILAVVVAGSASCGGGTNAAPTAPTTVTIAQSGSALPYGQAAGGGAPCPAGSPAGSECTRLSVSCSSVAVAAAVLRVVRSGSTSTNRGTLVLTTGGDGTAFPTNVSPLAPAMIATFAADGLTSVEVAWEPPGIWGGPQARTLACRYATTAKWVYENVHTGGRARLFAAQGTSGGASQVAFAHYGLSDFLNLASLGGGPPGCPLCSADGQHAPEPLLPAGPPAVSREPRLGYPATVVRFFLGDREPTPDIVVDANAYHNAITSAKSFTLVPNTAHDIEQTQAGVDAFVAAVRTALK